MLTPRAVSAGDKCVCVGCACEGGQATTCLLLRQLTSGCPYGANQSSLQQQTLAREIIGANAQLTVLIDPRGAASRLHLLDLVRPLPSVAVLLLLSTLSVLLIRVRPTVRCFSAMWASKEKACAHMLVMANKDGSRGLCNTQSATSKA